MATAKAENDLQQILVIKIVYKKKYKKYCSKIYIYI